MTSTFDGSGSLRGAVLHRVDVTGATFRDCDLMDVKIASSRVDNLRISGLDGRAGRVVVDDVDVTEFVDAELDRRHPERVQLRSVTTADDCRAMWLLLEQLWSQTLEAAAQQLPAAALHERVDDEWSFVETLRHLVFAIDTWVGRFIRQESSPYHPLGMPPTDFPAPEATALRLEMTATPSYDEVVGVFALRQSCVREVLAELTDEQLTQVRTAVLPVWGEESQPVAECLAVVFNEHCEHRRFAVRDLAVLAARQSLR